VCIEVCGDGFEVVSNTVASDDSSLISRQIQGADPGYHPLDMRGQSGAGDRRLSPYLIGWRGYFDFCQPCVCSPIWKPGSAEDYAHIFGG
jgi:hypothetical protein